LGQMNGELGPERHPLFTPTRSPHRPKNRREILLCESSGKSSLISPKNILSPESRHLCVFNTLIGRRYHKLGLVKAKLSVRSLFLIGHRDYSRLSKLVNLSINQKIADRRKYQRRNDHRYGEKIIICGNKRRQNGNY